MTATISTAISTTQSGAPVMSDGHSRSVGADGAIILNDHYDTAASSPTS
jgi:catalase